ncbi:MAG: DUF3341 domain-containing protein [Planctomycetota bacterium]
MSTIDAPPPPLTTPAAGEPVQPYDPKLTADEAPSRPFAVLGEFDNVDDVMAATHAAYAKGYRKMDVHTPFPIHGIDEALGIKPTILPWLVLSAGVTGMITGLLLTSYTMGIIQGPLPFVPVALEPYEYLISGKPYWSLAAYIPVIFELTIMFSAYTAVFAMFLLNKLPMLYNPLFRSDLMKRVTDDRFVLAIEATDRNFDEQDTEKFLKEQGALQTDLVTY